MRQEGTRVRYVTTVLSSTVSSGILGFDGSSLRKERTLSLTRESSHPFWEKRKEEKQTRRTNRIRHSRQRPYPPPHPIDRLLISLSTLHGSSNTSPSSNPFTGVPTNSYGPEDEFCTDTYRLEFTIYIYNSWLDILSDKKFIVWTMTHDLCTLCNLSKRFKNFYFD